MQNEGWICPVCRRGLAPGVRDCDHGNMWAWPVEPNRQMTIPADCGCPPGQPCLSTACPRRLNITCTSGGIDVPMKPGEIMLLKQ